MYSISNPTIIYLQITRRIVENIILKIVEKTSYIALEEDSLRPNITKNI